MYTHTHTHSLACIRTCSAFWISQYFLCEWRPCFSPFHFIWKNPFPLQFSSHLNLSTARMRCYSHFPSFFCCCTLRFLKETMSFLRVFLAEPYISFVFRINVKWRCMNIEAHVHIYPCVYVLVSLSLSHSLSMTVKCVCFLSMAYRLLILFECSAVKRPKKKNAMNSNAISFYLESIFPTLSLQKSLFLFDIMQFSFLYVCWLLFPKGISTMFKDTIRHIDFYICVFECRFTFGVSRFFLLLHISLVVFSVYL